MLRYLIMTVLVTLVMASPAHAGIEVKAGIPGTTNLKNTFVVERGSTAINLKDSGDTLTVAFCTLPQPAGVDCAKPLSYSLCMRNDCALPSSDRLTLVLAVEDRLLLQAPGGLASGDYKIKVTIGQENGSLDRFTVDRASPALRAIPYVASVAVILLMLWGAYAIASGASTEPSIGAIGFTGRLLLDRSNMTFSLSKLQFYGWTTVAVAAYVFYVTGRVLVQGQWDWAASDIGSGLPLVFLTAAGTSVATAGVNSATGGKGSGDFHPSMADLITSGGVVAPERVQFLAWTVIGWMSFLFYTFAVGPDHLTKLPSVPDGFIQIMGASSLGYLGGKLARGPGPQVRGATAEPVSPTNPDVILTIIGSNLGTEGATYQLQAAGKPAVQFKPEWLKPEKSAIGPNKRGTRLVFEIPAADYQRSDPNPAATDKMREFTITNDDGEKSAWQIKEP